MQEGGRGKADGLRVLLVEDSSDVREVFTLLLRSEGVDVVATGRGCEAVDLATSTDFDVVLTDLGLPDIPGEMVIRRVLAGARRRPRVIVVTGYDEPFVSRARQAGADLVFIKPILWSTLADILAAVRQSIRLAGDRLTAA